MTTDAILLIGRRTTHARTPFQTYADRLQRRTIVDEVHTATYEWEPSRELRDQVTGITADHVYAVPMSPAHTFDTLNELPAALAHVPGTVHYCEPLGRSPVVTEILVDQATELVPATDDVSFVIVSFGSSSKPYNRQVTEYHAARIREQSGYGQVVTCYLLQNPTVECVRYAISNDHAVAVPLFFTRSEATEERIPAQLELDRGGIEYADPFGDHARLTDAIHATVERERVLVRTRGSEPSSLASRLVTDRAPIATDGKGIPQ